MGTLIAVVLLAASPARADVGQTIIRRCGEGKSLSGYTQADYAKALREISPTTEEYSECGQLIRRAKEAAARGGSAGGGGTATAAAQALTATPAEQKSLARAVKSGSAPVQLGEGQPIHPGVVHANISSALSTLPAPVLALLAFAAVCLLGFGANALHKRSRDGRPY